MKIKRHGISIGIERIDNDFLLSIKAVGRLTHKDYEQIIPLLEYALEGVKHPQVSMLVDIRDFEGWGLHAVWDEFRLALKHGNEFSQIAVPGDEEWQEIATKIGGWFLSGEVRYFEEDQKAMDWLTTGNTSNNKQTDKKSAFSTHS
ncbi:STAS/SEC14 domain-containing protein [uncultured Microbulbifer sp.]|uniref:STAS/SEC14 domain-containing protein n=1 Tax=uncultured Microbulbifer sp. TaxID=348147 RepID=UPI002637B4B5|nr:STAS/SEC14 domain-containing protein [uncultured Microbulbifer sp.]